MNVVVEELVVWVVVGRWVGWRAESSLLDCFQCPALILHFGRRGHDHYIFHPGGGIYHRAPGVAFDMAGRQSPAGVVVQHLPYIGLCNDQHSRSRTIQSVQRSDKACRGPGGDATGGNKVMER